MGSLCAMSLEQKKTFKLVGSNLDVVEARMRIAAAAITHNVRLLAADERRTRFSTSYAVTVAGHPRRIREFHEGVRGDVGADWWLNDLEFDSGDDLLVGIVAVAVVGGVGALVGKGHKKWQARNDPPLTGEMDVEDSTSASGVRTSVHWRWERMLPDGDAVGPVQISIYFDGQDEPAASKDWPNWVKRSEALAFSQEHGFVFAPQDLPAE
jgi:hypothetical protein